MPLAQAQGREWKPPSEWTQLEWSVVIGGAISTTTSSMASIAVGMKERQLQRRIDRYRRYVWLRDYLDGNEVAIHQDTAIGAGPALADVLTQLYPSHSNETLQQACERLRARHEEIAEILSQPDTIERAARLHQALDEAIGLDQVESLPLEATATINLEEVSK